MESTAIENKSVNHLDSRLHQLTSELQSVKDACDKTFIEAAVDAKEPIDRFLTQTETEYQQLLDDGQRLLENIKIANDHIERDRLQQNRSEYDELQCIVLNEISASDRYLHDLWQQLKSLRGIDRPQAFNVILIDLRAQLSRIVNAKNATLNTFQNEINRMHRVYVDVAAKQETNIVCLCERMNKQLNVMRDFFGGKLKSLAKILDEELTKSRAEATAAWNEMHATHDVVFVGNSKRITEKTEACADAVRKMQIELDERNRATNGQMRMEMERCQYEMVRMKTMVTLNMDKMRYGYKILNRRKMENVLRQSYEKHKIAELNDKIIGRRKELAALTDEFAIEKLRKTKHLREVQRSLAFNEKCFHERYLKNVDVLLKVWQTHEFHCKRIFDLIGAAEHRLRRELLGIEDWSPLAIKEIDLSEMKIGNDGSTAELFDATPKAGIDLSALSNGAGFIIDDSLIKLLKPYSDTDRHIITADNILKALNISDSTTISTFKEHCDLYAFCPNCPSQTVNHEPNEFAPDMEVFTLCHDAIQTLITDAIANASQSDDSNAPAYQSCPNHVAHIKTEHVKCILRNFVQWQSVEKAELPPTTNNSNRQSFHHSGFVNNEQIDNYWMQYMAIFDTRNQRLWNVFEIGLNRLFVALKKRDELRTECELLRSQNAELNYCLRNFTEKIEE